MWNKPQAQAISWNSELNLQSSHNLKSQERHVPTGKDEVRVLVYLVQTQLEMGKDISAAVGNKLMETKCGQERVGSQSSGVANRDGAWTLLHNFSSYAQLDESPDKAFLLVLAWKRETTVAM